MSIDHVIYVAADLEAATAKLEDELGLDALEGGRHEGHGTVNRIVPLGGGYIELVTVADSDEAAGSVFGRGIGKRLADHGDGLFAWAVAVHDARAVGSRLGTSVSTISRRGLSARLAGLAEAMHEPFLPFFIERDRGVADPGATGHAGGTTWIEIAGDASRLETWLGRTRLPVRVVDGLDGVRAVGIGGREFRA